MSNPDLIQAYSQTRRDLCDHPGAKSVPIFVWRDNIDWEGLMKDGELSEPLEKTSYGTTRQVHRSCPYCDQALRFDPLRPMPNGGYDSVGYYRQACTFCGFTCAIKSAIVYHIGLDVSYRNALLKQLDINDSDLTIREVASHLRSHFSDVHALSPRNFERLVEDVFKHLGFRTRLTQTSRDGGYDIVLLDGSGGTQALVECKRYRKPRRVTVGIVRQIAGVQLMLGVPEAYIVTTTQFTNTAIKEAKRLSEAASGYRMKLVDADTLLGHLSVYDPNLPPVSLQEKIKMKMQERGLELHSGIAITPRDESSGVLALAEFKAPHPRWLEIIGRVFAARR